VIQFSSPFVGEGIGVRGFVDPWPFEDEDWDNVVTITGRLTNAILADDEVLRQSIREELIQRIDDLTEKYGEHPVLLETLADFVTESNWRLGLYRRALDLSVKHGMPTLTIRVFLAVAARRYSGRRGSSQGFEGWRG